MHWIINYPATRHCKQTRFEWMTFFPVHIRYHWLALCRPLSLHKYQTHEKQAALMRVLYCTMHACITDVWWCEWMCSHGNYPCRDCVMFTPCEQPDSWSFLLRIVCSASHFSVCELHYNVVCLAGLIVTPLSRTQSQCSNANWNANATIFQLKYVYSIYEIGGCLFSVNVWVP